MLKNVKWLGHSAIKITDENKTIYIDPYDIEVSYKDADIIFITHSHYDHFSKDDIKKVRTDKTKIIVTEDLYQESLNLEFDEENIYTVIPNETYNIDSINFSTIPAYNTDKDFHSKEKGWVGYIIEVNNIKYYIAGDTDITEENRNISCDIAFIPVGGTYTMNALEAAALANSIKPKVVVPIHYGSIIGSKKDADKFRSLIDDSIECEFLL